MHLVTGQGPSSWAICSELFTRRRRWLTYCGFLACAARANALIRTRTPNAMLVGKALLTPLVVGCWANFGTTGADTHSLKLVHASDGRTVVQDQGSGVLS